MSIEKTVSIVGLGKLGASMAAAIASRGFTVIGYDTSHRSVDLINAGQAPVFERGLQNTISMNSDRIEATQDIHAAIAGSSVTFVVVPTPSEATGAFSLDYAEAAFEAIGSAIAAKEDYHLVVLTSTVLPGDCRNRLIPLLESSSGKNAGRDFGFCYSPIFVSLGNIIQEFLEPDFWLVGELDDTSGAMLKDYYQQIAVNNAGTELSGIENAELSKIAINTYVTTKITFANMLSDLCDRIEGGDVDEVVRIVGSDSRIGRKYLRGGTSYGGPCFPRDNLALSYFAESVGGSAELARATDALNRAWPKQLIDKLGAELEPGMTVAILGAAYKPFSDVIEESPGIELARSLLQAGMIVRVYDPVANAAVASVLLEDVVINDSLGGCLANADAVIIATPDPAFANLEPEVFVSRCSSPVIIIDPWRILRELQFDSDLVRYMPLGVNRLNSFRSSRPKSARGS